MGLVGVGVGASQLLPALSTSPHIQLVAAADVRSAALEQFASEFGTQTYASVEALAEDPRVEAVWVATPNQLHAQHVIAAAERGKHVIVSKPMAISLDEAAAMNLAAERYGVKLLAGHTQSMAPTIRKMAELVHSGELGQLGMLHTWHFTDWMYRPRLPAELDVNSTVRSIPVADELRGAAELEELYQAVRYERPIVHDGRWGEATLEVCLAIVESARTHADVRLSRQTALPT